MSRRRTSKAWRCARCAGFERGARIECGNGNGEASPRRVVAVVPVVVAAVAGSRKKKKRNK
jgi:hypothetical protein